MRANMKHTRNKHTHARTRIEINDTIMNNVICRIWNRKKKMKQNYSKKIQIVKSENGIVVWCFNVHEFCGTLICITCVLLLMLEFSCSVIRTEYFMVHLNSFANACWAWQKKMKKIEAQKQQLELDFYLNFEKIDLLIGFVISFISTWQI